MNVYWKHWFLILIFAFTMIGAAQENIRQIAITIDDLPLVRGRTAERMQRITRGLLDNLQQHKAPAIGFVNERKLGEPDALPERVALLQQWLDAGMDLGNHTYSHPSLYRTPLEDYQEEVLRGEKETKKLLEAAGKEMRYFRHPYLNTGPELAVKNAFEVFLKEHNYVVAPVTIDNEEWIYAQAYDKASDKAERQKIGEDYLRYMAEVFDFYEELSRNLLGYEPAQILLIHANALNADYLGKLCEMMVERGYQFVSIDAALQDKAYQQADNYVGRSGISWLQRWRITRGEAFLPEPTSPDWLKALARS